MKDKRRKETVEKIKQEAKNKNGKQSQFEDEKRTTEKNQ